MKTIFIASGPKEWGSARMRCYWPAKYMQDASVVQRNSILPINADAYIFQKQAANLETMQELKGMGKKVYFDLCDPMHWWEPDYVREIAKTVDRVVCSSLALALDFTEWSGIECDAMPDRLDMAHFTDAKEHTEHSPIRLLWYGVSVNRISLFAALANLERLACNGVKIELTICDDAPQHNFAITNLFPIHHKQWSLENEVETLLAHDIALLPPYPGRWGAVKSNNKMLTAWACGLPTTTGESYNELYDMCTSLEMRNHLGSVGRYEVERNWTVDKSALEWTDIINGTVKYE